jgi:hypothetical protein
MKFSNEQNTRKNDIGFHTGNSLNAHGSHTLRAPNEKHGIRCRTLHVAHTNSPTLPFVTTSDGPRSRTDDAGSSNIGSYSAESRFIRSICCDLLGIQCRRFSRCTTPRVLVDIVLVVAVDERHARREPHRAVLSGIITLGGIDTR